MKLLHLFFCGTFSCLWAACSLCGAPTVLERGQNYRLLQTQQTYINEYGQEVVTPGRFTELKAGMHYQENGRWVESEEIIEPHPQGAVARRGAYQVIFNQNLN